MPRPDIDTIRKASSGIYLGEPQCYVRPLLDYVAELEAQLADAREALRKICTLGSVCPDFATCDHLPCGDSCGAVLVASAALAELPLTGWVERQRGTPTSSEKAK